MFLRGLPIWCLLLTCHISTYDLELSGIDSHEVICSQGLSNCTMEDVMFLTVEENGSVNVRNLKPYFMLCCKDREPCKLCLVIDTEINIHADKDMEDEDHSGTDGEDYNEDTRTQKVSSKPYLCSTVSVATVSMSVCYHTAQTLPTCKRVECAVNHTGLTQHHEAKVSMVLTEPAGITYGSQVIVYSGKQKHVKNVAAPSLNKVCSQRLHNRVEECGVPRLHSVINKKRDQVELQFVGRNRSLPNVCVQYEPIGRCQRWSRMTIPLYSVAPCMCFQIWDEDDRGSRRSLSCPFIHTNFLHRNTWENISVTVNQGQMSDYRSMLSWNISAPCRLEGEVWPCHREISCKEVRGYRQKLEKSKWVQNTKGLWVKLGVFEDINLQLSSCVMVTVKGMGHDLGPFCFKNTDRWRWSLLVVGVMFLVCLTVIVAYLLHGFVKKWVWSCRHGGFVRVGSKCHVVLLSPPDVDASISESVSQLGSLLSNHGFSVSVDQWSRKEQCTLGPLPWLHSQLLELKSQGGRVVLVLTQKALERAEEWSRWYKKNIKTKREDKCAPQICSPYSDVFTASLCIIQADTQQGRAGERFLLVTFDSDRSSEGSLPELLQGLPLFQLPSKTQALLSDLSVGGTAKWT